MKKLLYTLAISLWVFIVVQALQIQHADAVKFEAYSQHALELEQELKLDAERLQAVDSTAAQIVLDTLRNVQQAQEVNLGDMYFTANDTLGHLSR